MKRFLSALLLAGGLLVAGSVGATVNVSITESGGNLSVESSGTILQGVCSALNPTSGGGPSLQPSISLVYFFGGSTQFCSTTINAPSGFGTSGILLNGSSSNTSYWGIDPTSFFVPAGFSSSTSFAATATYTGTFASLGITPGTYTYTLSNGATSDTIVITVHAAPAAVPSLSEWAQLMLALMVMTVIGWHFHRERSY